MRKNNVIAAILLGIIVSSAVSFSVLHSLEAQQYSNLINSLKRQLEDSLLSKSSNISKVTSRHISEIIHVTEIVASNAAVAPSLNRENLGNLLDSVLYSEKTISAIYFLDKDGILVYTTNTNPVAQSYLGRSLSNHVSFVGAKEKNGTFVSPLTEAITNDSFRVFVSTPMTDPVTGEFRGVAVSSVLSDTLAASINRDVALGGDYSIALVDTKGYVTASSGSGGTPIGTNIFSEDVLGQLPEPLRESFGNALTDAINGRTGVYTIDMDTFGQNSADEISDVVMIGYTPVIIDDETIMASFIVESASIQRLLRESENPALSDTFIVAYTVLIIMAIFAAVIIVINRRLSAQVARSTLVLEKNNQDLQTTATSLIKKSDELEKANRARDEFSAMITHELKTPLVPIIAYSELLLSGSLGGLTQQQKEKIKIMHDSSKSLTRLISDLLDVRKLELGQLKLDIGNVPAQDIISKAIESTKPLADSKNVLLLSYPEKSDKGSLMVKADQKRVEQVLNNLITNAVKFAPDKNGVVQVWLKRDDKHAIFAVEDNGIGIPADKSQNIFQKFYQADTSSTRSGGSGLGLAISKGIVESHGGKIWFESKVGAGSTFYFSIPLVVAETQPVEPGKLSADNNK